MSDTQQEPGGNQQTSSPQTLKEYVTKDMVATTLFTLRLCTIFGTFMFLLSNFGLFVDLGYRSYLNVMLTTFFTFFIRLYGRKQERQISMLSKEMYLLFSTEDSGHYIIYSFFYYYQYPLAIYIIPPFLYAVLSSIPYTNGLIPFLPPSIQSWLVHLNGRVTRGQMEMRRFIAYTEIFMMLVVTWNALAGYMFFLAPLVHYKFLQLRYQSVRNHSVGLVFSELRLGIEYLSRHPRCPKLAADLLTKGITFISNLAPSRQMRREP